MPEDGFAPDADSAPGTRRRRRLRAGRDLTEDAVIALVAPAGLTEADAEAPARPLVASAPVAMPAAPGVPAAIFQAPQ
jgi:hypothetical protein